MIPSIKAQMSFWKLTQGKGHCQGSKQGERPFIEQLETCDLNQSHANFSMPQNHGMVEVGRDVWRLSRPTHLIKQGPLELVAQDVYE